MSGENRVRGKGEDRNNGLGNKKNCLAEGCGGLTEVFNCYPEDVRKVKKSANM